MDYIHPYGIIPAERFQNLVIADLKNLRKKVLLEFDLSDSAEIFRGKEGYDKNRVLEIFQSVENHLPLYQKIAVLPGLQGSINNGDLGFFTSSNERHLIDYDQDNKAEINYLIVNKLQRIIPPLIIEPSVPNAETLRNINQYLTYVSDSEKQVAFNNTFLELSHVISELGKIENPYENDRYLSIKKEVKKYFSKPFYTSLVSLPNSLIKLLSDYGLWCNNNVLVPGLKDKKINRAPKPTLIVIRNAAKIASEFYNKEENLKIVKHLDTLIKGSKYYTSNEDSGGFKWQYIIYIIILFIKVPLIISKCSSNNSRSSYNSPSYSSTKNSQFVKDKELRDILKQYENKKRKSPSTKSSSKSSAELFRFIGEERGFLNASFRGERTKNNMIELKYDVDIIPTKNTFFYKLIPSQIISKYKGEVMPVIFTFRNRNLKKNEFSHEVKIDFRKDKLESLYNYKKPPDGEKDILKTKKLLNSKLKFNGVISKINPKTKKIEHTRKLRVNYNETDDGFICKPTNPINKIRLDKDYIAADIDYKNTSDSDSIRIAAIIKNLKLIPSSRLTRNGIYTLANVAAYDLQSNEGYSLLLKNPAIIEGRLKYRITSVVDDVSMCSVTASNFAAFYFIDNNTSKIKMMTMVIKSKDGENIELIQVELS